LTPSAFAYHVASTDHIVVTNRPTGQQASPRVANYSLTITGQEMQKIVQAIISLQTSINNHLPDIPASYKWQIQFYRGDALLGTLDLSDDSVLDDGWEYHAPRILRELYHRATKESVKKE
jgi:hypothetical protein